jgi:hypothetical protein
VGWESIVTGSHACEKTLHKSPRVRGYPRGILFHEEKSRLKKIKKKF